MRVINHCLVSALLLLFFSCSHVSVSEKPKTDKQIKTLVIKGIKALNRPQVENIYVGHARIIKRELPKVISDQFKKKQLDLELKCRDQKTKFSMIDNQLVSFVSNNYHRPKNFTCDLMISGGPLKRSKKVRLFKLVSTPYKFKVEKLNVPKKHIDLSPENVARWKKEVKLQKKIYSSSLPYPLFQENFRVPLESYITSPYGVKRLFNNKKSSWHSGTDYRASTGTEIPSANRGKVVFAGELFFNGNAVIIDHGLDIFTMYCHLSKIKAKEGEIVPKGEIIGLSGATGRVSGPHLHWGVKVQGNWVAGIPFAQEQIN